MFGKAEMHQAEWGSIPQCSKKAVFNLWYHRLVFIVINTNDYLLILIKGDYNYSIMKKTLIYATKIQKLDPPQIYRVKDEDKGESVCYPMNSIINNVIQENDEVDVIILKNTNGIKDSSSENAEILKKEVQNVLKEKNCSITFKEIPMLFEGTSSNLKKCFLDLLSNLEYKSEIYVDVTFGPKFIPFLVFASINYSEKYFDSNCKAIYYGEVYFDENNKVMKDSAKLRNLTSVYRLNSVCNEIVASPKGYKFIIGNLFV